MQQYFLLLFLTFCNLIKQGEGHGRLVDPPSRSSMWRYGYTNPPNYNDNQLYCGGVQVQYEQNGGRCGVCGDPWPGPRDNEEGGKYSNGVIVRSYEPGEIIIVTVELTASHKGYFEFKLCPKDDPMQKTTQQCLDNYILQLADGSGTKFQIKSRKMHQILPIKLKLPENVKCRDCTFQWKYNAGNSWGEDEYGRGCLGCGKQEQFYACADIAIGHDEIEEGDSLITGKNYKKDNYVPPPPPIHPPVATEEDLTTEEDSGSNFGNIKQTSNFWDALVSQSDTNKKVVLFDEYKKFQQLFTNQNVRPCVCHSCVGNTCVCECIPSLSHGHSYILKGINEWLIYILSMVSCIIPILLF